MHRMPPGGHGRTREDTGGTPQTVRWQLVRHPAVGRRLPFNLQLEVKFCTRVIHPTDTTSLVMGIVFFVLKYVYYRAIKYVT